MLISFARREELQIAHKGSPLGSDWVNCVASLSTEQAYYDLKAQPHVLIRTMSEPAFWISLLPQSLLGSNELEMVTNGTSYDRNFTIALGDYMSSWSGRTIVDIGSKSGWLSAFAARLGHKAYVFEEDAHSIVKLCQTQSANQFGSSHRIINVGLVSNSSSGTVVTLDNFFGQEGCIEMVSMLNVADVNGMYATAVIEGAWRFLEQCDVRAVLLEMSPVSMPTSFTRVYKKLLGLGFKVSGVAQSAVPMVMNQHLGITDDNFGERLRQLCGMKCSVWWMQVEEVK